MTSSEAFRVMEDFAHSLSDDAFKAMLLNRPSRRKPFQNFRMEIDDSDYREDWFAFKDKAYMDFVRMQLE
jgi:hypothetical protein